MNINEFLVKLFGSANSNAEYEQIEHWKEEGLANAKSLQEMLKVNTDASGLSDYKTYDVEQAMMLNMEMLEQELPVKKTRNLKKVFTGLVSVLLLLALAGFAYSYFSKSPVLQYASTAGPSLLKNGTEVKLNERSNYTYDHESNTLELSGEAHFDVAKQESPFVITTENGTITVLGTKFNVVATDESTQVYMYEGVVKYNLNGKEVTLREGDFVEADKELKILNNQNAQVFSYWHTGKLEYKNVALDIVLRDINRIYGKSLTAHGVDAKEILISSSFAGNSLKEIVMIIEKIANVSIK